MKRNLLSIYLIGTSGGYGESVLINFPNGKWIVIDSCFDPNTKTPLPLTFLQENNISPSDVIGVYCTHWHDDHIKGLSKILEWTKNADFGVSICSDKDKFYLLTLLDNEKDPTIRSTIEFQKCIDILKSRGKNPKLIVKNKLLYRDHTYMIDFFSLSPSDAGIIKYNTEIGQLINSFGGRGKKIIKTGPNLRSVVFYLKMPNNSALFGADMEFCSSSGDDGWQDIIDDNVVVTTKSHYFKIPHHGSETGYSTTLWEKLIEKDAIASLTPWNRNSKLPQLEMLTKFKQHTPHVFMTSPNYGNKAKTRSRDLEKMIEQFSKKISEIKFNKGIISATIDIDDKTNKWQVNCEFSALKL